MITRGVGGKGASGWGGNFRWGRGFWRGDGAEWGGGFRPGGGWGWGGGRGRRDGLGVGPGALGAAGEQGPHRGRAVEALAAAVQDAGASAQAVKVGGRQRARERVPDLPAGDPLAVADNAAILGVSRDLGRVLVGPRPRLTQIGHDRRRRPGRVSERQPRACQQPGYVLGDAKRGGKAGRPDAGHARVPAP